MSKFKSNALAIHGWTIFAHPLFLTQIDASSAEVEGFKQKDPVGFVNKNANKRLAAIAKLAFEVIPQDPTRPEYRQGGTLSERHKHWFRAKFFQQYRLFFRYRVPSKVIVFAWVNDEKTKRAFEGGNDAYRVFRKMVENGHPPDDWGALLAESKVGVKRWYLPTCAVFGIRFLLDNGNRYPINVFSINVDDIGVDSENGK